MAPTKPDTEQDRRFRRDLRAWVEKEHGRGRELAKAVGCAPATINRIYEGKSKSGKYLRPICEYTGIVPPRIETTDPWVIRLWLALEKRPEKDRKSLVDRMIAVIMEG